MDIKEMEFTWTKAQTCLLLLDPDPLNRYT